MRYVFIVLLAFVFVSCSSKRTQLQKGEIYDLVTIPQDVHHFSRYIDDNSSGHQIQDTYDKLYFSVWNIEEPLETVDEIKWPFTSYRADNAYGENLQPLKQDFFDAMYENSNFDAFATINKKAISIKYTNIRAFPANRPLLRDPSLAGEGFPFDYLQNSSIAANKPLFVSHYSRDKEWVYVFSSFANGWVKHDEVVYLEKKHTDTIQKAHQVVFTKEDIPLYDMQGNFLFKSRIGMRMPLIDESDAHYTVLAISIYKNGSPLFLNSKISKDIAHKGILRLDKKNLPQIVNEVSKTNYGWGGMYDQRDCSSMLRDLFTPFGIWLPRNSYQQSKIGQVISLKDLSDEEKIARIKKQAVAFQTLLYKKGHIVLYVGTYNDTIVVFHNTWGIKTKKGETDGRIIIGAPIFSSLKLGKDQEDYDEEAEILKNLESMNILTKEN
ncbi:SH3 domain-containing protein [bacterium]|nr:SH3 domain-containing protein [bacterium]MBU1991086.1 SH3 domain-containing protein [bacterium]